MNDDVRDPGDGADGDQPDEALAERLRAALPAEVSDATRTRHLAELDETLDPRAGLRGVVGRWRDRVGATLAAAATVLAPAGVAVAAESAVPGDSLYGVKRVTERMQAVVFDEVVLEHRIAELDVLLQRDDAERDVVVDVVREGVEAALDQPDEPELQERMSGLALVAADRFGSDRLPLDRLPTRVAAGPSDEATPTDRPTSDRPTDVPSDEPVRDRPGDGASATPTSRPTDDAPAPSDSPAPTDRPSPAPSPTASPTTTDAPRPSPSPLPPEPEPSPSPTSRTERYQAGEAGVVFLDVGEGVRFAGVRVRDGWKHETDRRREPEVVVVRFANGDRRIVLTARATPDGVRVTVEEKDTPPSDRG